MDCGRGAKRRRGGVADRRRADGDGWHGNHRSDTGPGCADICIENNTVDGGGGHAGADSDGGDSK